MDPLDPAYNTSFFSQSEDFKAYRSYAKTSFDDEGPGSQSPKSFSPRSIGDLFRKNSRESSPRSYSPELSPKMGRSSKSSDVSPRKFPFSKSSETLPRKPHFSKTSDTSPRKIHVIGSSDPTSKTISLKPEPTFMLSKDAKTVRKTDRLQKRVSLEILKVSRLPNDCTHKIAQSASTQSLSSCASLSYTGEIKIEEKYPKKHIITRLPREKETPSFILTGSKEKKGPERLEKSLIYRLSIQWKEKEKPSISQEKLEHALFVFCRKKIFKLMVVEGQQDYLKLYEKAAAQAPILLRAIQKKGILLVDIIERLKIFYEGIKAWHDSEKNRTKASVLLQSWLELIAHNAPLFEDRERDLAAFLDSVDALKKVHHEKTVELIFKAFGDAPQQIHSTLTLLKMWSAASEPDCIKAFSKLDFFLRQACSEVILAKVIPHVKHSFFLSDKYAHIIRNISPKEVRRCLKPLHQKYILFEYITINGKDFYTGGTSKSHHFFLNLFTTIYNYFECDLTENAIKEQVFYFKEISDFSEIFNIEKTMPCFNILKLMTNSCWGIGDAYFRAAFPTLNSPPYWLKLESGIGCNIQINSSQNFAVSQFKTYTVHPLLNAADTSSLCINKNRPLARLLLSWTVKMQDRQFKGKLHLAEVKILPAATQEEKWLIYDTLKNLTHVKRILPK